MHKHLSTLHLIPTYTYVQDKVLIWTSVYSLAVAFLQILKE